MIAKFSRRRPYITTGLMMSLLLCLVWSGCSTQAVLDEGIQEPHCLALELCREGKYLQAMKDLVRTQTQWQEYTKQTGRTAEGAAGFERYETMYQIATKGDAQWARILDDRTIPYSYKTEMIFEILELRLGKGAVYMGPEQENFIVPRFGRADLEKIMSERHSE